MDNADDKLDPLVVSLDLDETLIYCSQVPFHYRGETFEMVLDDEIYYGSVRPGARELIEHLFENKERFSVGVFSASTPDYVKKVLEHLIDPGQMAQLLFVLTRENIRMGTLIDLRTGWDVRENKPQPLKDLSKVKRKAKRRSRDRIIAVDDKPMLWPRTYGNILPVPEFNADTLDDSVMKGTRSALDFLSRLDDVRPIEKRGMVIRHANRLLSSKDRSMSLSTFSG